MPTEKDLNNAAASLIIEGFEISDELKKLCMKKIKGEITSEEYIYSALKLQGVKTL